MLFGRQFGFRKQEIALIKPENDLDERENALNERENALNERENALNERENGLNKREKNLRAREIEFGDEVFAKERGIAQKMERMELYEAALRATELKILDWVSRMEKREMKVFEEISKDVDTYTKFHFDVNIDGYKFEEVIAALLRKCGYQDVTVTPKSCDFGADIIAEKDMVKSVFQCKYYSSPVGIEAVQQIYSAKDYYNANLAFVVTNSTFTKAAKTLASELKVILWDCEVLTKLIQSNT